MFLWIQKLLLVEDDPEICGMLKKFLEKDPPEWAQYVLSKEAMRFIREAYRMPGIPRFMLVNPEGYLVNFKYTCPSDPQCAELIEQDMKDNK